MAHHLIESADRVVLEPEISPHSCVIWLHGLGADGHDFVPIVHAMKLDSLPIRFVFPHAPFRQLTAFNRMRLRAWFDVLSGERGPQTLAPGIDESIQRIQQMIAEQRALGIDARCIVLAGFSQGGAVVSHLLLRSDTRLAGALLMSTYLPDAANALARLHTAALATPVQLHHGTADPVLPYALGLSLRETLAGLGFAVDWHSWRMGHEVCPEQLAVIRPWLAARLRPAPSV